jgi:hypothetical protein
MNDLWEFSKKFLASYPVGVCDGTLGICAKLSEGSWESGLELERVENVGVKRDKETVVREFLARLDDQEQIQEVLDSAADDYKDESYFDVRDDFPARLSYYT